MADYEKRFAGFAHEQVSRCVAELEEQSAIRGAASLTTEDIEELLVLLPRNYFKLLFRMRLREIARGKKEFAEMFPDLSDAAEKLLQECRQKLDSEAEEDKDDIITLMDHLRLSDPALWFQTYRKLREHSLSMALELEAPDKTKPFDKP